MGRYTHLDDPRVDGVVEDHLRQIVQAVLASTSAQTIILRGSFARGEGSIFVEPDGSLSFLSDYELMAVSPSFQDRETLRRVGDELTRSLGVETSITRLSPPAAGQKRIVPPTIMMYEMQQGGMTLFGPPMPEQTVSLDPRHLDPWSGLRLLFNRMGELLETLPEGGQTAPDWAVLRFVNKTVLASAEAVLAASGNYHYSYAERGRLFGQMQAELQSVTPYAAEMIDLVSRATEFKLRPSRAIYAEPLPHLLEKVRHACDAALRYGMLRLMKFTFTSYAEFPSLYKKNIQAKNLIQRRIWPVLPVAFSQNLYLSLRYLHDTRRLSVRQALCLSYPAQHIVYSVLPLVFFGGDAAVLAEARRCLGKVMRLPPSCAHPQDELAYLQKCAVRAWKDYCYGLWESL